MVWQLLSLSKWWMIACLCLLNNNIGFSFLIVLTAFSHPGYSPLHLRKLHFHCNQSIDSFNTTTNKTCINMYQKFGKKSLSKLKFLILNYLIFVINLFITNLTLTFVSFCLMFLSLSSLLIILTLFNFNVIFLTLFFLKLDSYFVFRFTKLVLIIVNWLVSLKHDWYKLIFEFWFLRVRH